MNKIQLRAFSLAKSKLDPTSKWYQDDLAALRECYSKKSASDCQDAIDRFQSKMTDEEIDRHCMFDALGTDMAGYV